MEAKAKAKAKAGRSPRRRVRDVGVVVSGGKTVRATMARVAAVGKFEGAGEHPRPRRAGGEPAPLRYLSRMIG